MNKFQAVDGPSNHIVFLNIWREDGIIMGEVTDPVQVEGGYITGLPARPLPVKEALALAALVANRRCIPIGVMVEPGIWQAEWGDLVQ